MAGGGGKSSSPSESSDGERTGGSWGNGECNKGALERGRLEISAVGLGIGAARAEYRKACRRL
jgi:hypothetical protein